MPFKDTDSDPLEVLEDLKTSPDVVCYSTRYVLVTDYVEFIATDIQTGEAIGFPIREIDQHFIFFLPWAGQYVAEAHADVKAPERKGKLFDELLTANPDLLERPHGRRALNLFFTR